MKYEFHLARQFIPCPPWKAFELEEALQMALDLADALAYNESPPVGATPAGGQENLGENPVNAAPDLLAAPDVMASSL